MRLAGTAALLLAIGAASHAAVVSFDFAGSNPGQSTEWTTTSSIDANATLTQGVMRSGAGSLNSRAGDNAFYANYDNGPGEGTDSPLSEAFTTDRYVSFKIAPNAGYAINFAGEALSAVLMRDSTDPAMGTDVWHSPRQIAITSSIEGFTTVLAEYTTPYKWDSGNYLATGTFPNTAAYSGITGTVEFRIYFSEGQYGAKPTGVDDIAIGGSVSAIPEPASLALLGIMATGLLGRKRQK